MIRTGSTGIDIALGGGWTPGTMNEIWGDTGGAKTVLAKHTVESMVRAHKDALWIDLDGSARYMDGMPGMIMAYPRNAEQAFMMAWHACAVPEIGLIVFDPAQMLVRQRELDGDPAYVPHPQREYRVELNELKTAAALSQTTVLFCSQPRDKQREPVRGTGISEKVEWRVHLHPDVVHQNGSREIVATVKNVPGKSVVHEAARFTVRPRLGIDRVRELISIATDFGIIKRRGSWLQYGQLRCHGVEDMWFALHTSMYQYTKEFLEQDIRKMASIP
jgi:recombination protein RecA